LLSFFRINDPYRLLVAFLLLLVGRLAYGLWGAGISVPEMGWMLIGERLGNGFVMYRDLYDHTGPLSTLTYRMMDYIFGRTIISHRILSFVLICLNATILSLQLVRSKAFKENNYLPGFFYVLLALAIPEGGALSPMLMSSTFILLALSNVFRRVDNEASDELFLYAGLYLGIASLFYLPAIVFFVILLLSLLVFSTAIPRRMLLYFYGLIVPMILGIANYYWYDAFDYFIDQFFVGSFILERRYYVTWSSFFVIGGVFIFWLLYSLTLVLGRGRYGNFETKVIQIMLLLAVAAVFAVYFDVTLQPAQLYLFIPTLAFLLSHLSLLLRRRIFKIAIPTLLIASLILNAYLLEKVDPNSQYLLKKETIPGVLDKKVMVLSDVPERYYVDQHFAGPFLNKELSQAQTEYLQYYETSFQLYNAIVNDPPSLIVDEWLLMPEVLFRFPTLSEQYRQGANNRYYRLED
jgi:4-amino-4-deoxy-L-arabinose transferase-like glycosyltransferase